MVHDGALNTHNKLLTISLPRPPPKERLVEQLVRARALGPPRAALRGLRAGSHAVVASMASGAALPSPTVASQRNSASERVESPRTPAAPRHLRELPSGTRRRANETTPQGPLWLPLARRINMFIDPMLRGKASERNRKFYKAWKFIHTKIKTKGHSGPQRLGGALLRQQRSRVHGIPRRRRRRLAGHH